MPPSPNGSNEIWDPQSRSLWSNTSYEGHGTQRSVTETEWNDCFWAMRSYINMCIYIIYIYVYRVALSVFSEFLEIKINIIIIVFFPNFDVLVLSAPLRPSKNEWYEGEGKFTQLGRRDTPWMS